jgi:hypothetical protein
MDGGIQDQRSSEVDNLGVIGIVGELLATAISIIHECNFGLSGRESL